MTKKDFEAIAGAIKDAREALKVGPADPISNVDLVLNGLARTCAKVLATTSPKFDRARFLAACGVK